MSDGPAGRHAERAMTFLDIYNALAADGPGTGVFHWAWSAHGLTFCPGIAHPFVAWFLVCVTLVGAAAFGMSVEDRLRKMSRQNREMHEFVLNAALEGRPELIGVSHERFDGGIRLTVRIGGCLTGLLGAVILTTLWLAWGASSAAAWWRPGTAPGVLLVVCLGAGLLPIATAIALRNATYRVTLEIDGNEGTLETRVLGRTHARRFRVTPGTTAKLEPIKPTPAPPPPDMAVQSSRCVLLTTNPPFRFGHELAHVQRAYVVHVLGEYLDEQG